MDFAKFDRFIRMQGVLERAMICIQLQNDEHQHSTESDLETSLDQSTQPNNVSSTRQSFYSSKEIPF